MLKAFSLPRRRTQVRQVGKKLTKKACNSTSLRICSIWMLKAFSLARPRTKVRRVAKKMTKSLEVIKLRGFVQRQIQQIIIILGNRCQPMQQVQ